MGVIIFNNKSSSDLGLEIETYPDYTIPEKLYDVIQVPGRNGDLLIDSNTYSNTTRQYKVSAAARSMSLYHRINDIVEWLHSASGYARLEDSYEPDYFRMACYRESNNIENIFNEAGKATITFDCKPQRYLKTGESVITITSSESKVTNPTQFTSYPIIRVYSSNSNFGTVTVGGRSFVLSQAAGSTCIEVNSEIQDVYDGYKNMNSYITLNGGEFPNLMPGGNAISFTSNIQKVEVIPKWWTI